MDLLSTSVLQLALLICFSQMMTPLGFIVPGDNERKCNYVRSSRMLKIRCHDMNLKEVPQSLKSSVEILDLSFNRIKKLKRSSFEKYKSLKYLLLYENKVQSVEPGTFSHLSSLQEIDLSNNALVTIPLEILQLPSLRNLYVDSNELFNLERDLQTLDTPIRAPLEYLNLADCGLQKVPDFGLLPKLWHLNISMNPLTEFSVGSFANMCNLNGMDLTKTEITECSCQQVNQHLRTVGADTKFVPVCLETLDIQVCPEPYNDTILSETYQRCKSEIQRVEHQKWIVNGSYCTLGFLVFLLLVCCIFWRCRRRSKKHHIKKQQNKPHQPLVSPTAALKNNNDRSVLHDSDCM